MKKIIEKYGLIILIVYLILSVYISLLRTMPKISDCTWRYVDIIFPLSHIHCPIGE